MFYRFTWRKGANRCRVKRLGGAKTAFWQQNHSLELTNHRKTLTKEAIRGRTSLHHRDDRSHPGDSEAPTTCVLSIGLPKRSKPTESGDTTSHHLCILPIKNDLRPERPELQQQKNPVWGLKLLSRRDERK